MASDFTGFIINEENRQHVTLSSYAMSVIEGDMLNFNKDYDLTNKSGYINKIISNYYDCFPLSPNVALKQIVAIGKTLENDDFGKKITNRIIEEFSNEIMKSIINEYSNKFSNDVPFKIKLNKENRNLLESLEEAKFFNDYAPRSGISFYIKAILETYATLSREQRERVFFKKIIDVLENSIKNKTYVKYKYNSIQYKSTALYIYKPYNKQSLEVVMFHQNRNPEDEWSALETIKLKDLNEQNLRELKERSQQVHNKEVIQLVEQSIMDREIKSQKHIKLFTIKFTDYGLERFFIEEDNFPIVGIQDMNNETIFTFKATESQIFQYLFKFGAQAQIISPNDARDRFKKLYKVSYDVYNQIPKDGV